jgi:hypothetical protein
MTPCSKAPGSTSNFGRYISLIVSFCTVGRFFCHSQHGRDFEGFICLPRHRSTKEHVSFLSALGADIASALQQWIFGQSQSPRNLFFNSETGGLLPLNHGEILDKTPARFYCLYISFNRRRWPTSPTFLKLVTFYTCYNVDSK